jgi:hypothetical protein
VRAAANQTVTTSKWISHDASGLEAYMWIAQPPKACKTVLTGGTASGQNAYWAPSNGTVDESGRMTMTLMPTEAPLKGQAATTKGGLRSIAWANGVTWFDCASPGAPDCTMDDNDDEQS